MEAVISIYFNDPVSRLGLCKRYREQCASYLLEKSKNPDDFPFVDDSFWFFSTILDYLSTISGFLRAGSYEK